MRCLLEHDWKALLRFHNAMTLRGLAYTLNCGERFTVIVWSSGERLMATATHKTLCEAIEDMESELRELAP